VRAPSVSRAAESGCDLGDGAGSWALATKRHHRLDRLPDLRPYVRRDRRGGHRNRL